MSTNAIGSQFFNRSFKVKKPDAILMDVDIEDLSMIVKESSQESGGSKMAKKGNGKREGIQPVLYDSEEDREGYSVGQIKRGGLEGHRVGRSEHF